MFYTLIQGNRFDTEDDVCALLFVGWPSGQRFILLNPHDISLKVEPRIAAIQFSQLGLFACICGLSFHSFCDFQQGGLQNNPGNHPAFLTEQYVIGAAGSARVHKLYAYALIKQAGITFGVRELQNLTGTNQDHFRLYHH
jgi:hypothetical protein